MTKIIEGTYNDRPKMLSNFGDTFFFQHISEPFSLGKIQNQSIRNSKFVPFELSGHGSFYDERDRFNKELVRFIEE